jgi:hypothetical protein
LSLELPVGFQNVRQGINEIIISISGVKYSSLVPTRTYSSTQSLIYGIFDALSNHPSGYTFTVMQTDDNNILIISTIPNTNWFFVDTIFSNLFMGIYQTDLPYQNGIYQNLRGTGKPNINIDNSISLYIPEIGTNANNSKTTFKIPLPVSTGQILYLTENIFFKQEVSCNVNSLNTLTCKFYDRMGYDLTSLGYSWSASVEITHEG